MDHPRCAQLAEGDVLLEVNGENVQDYSHLDLVNVLKRCPKGHQAAFLVFRQAQPPEDWNVSVWMFYPVVVALRGLSCIYS